MSKTVRTKGFFNTASEIAYLGLFLVLFVPIMTSYCLGKVFTLLSWLLSGLLVLPLYKRKCSGDYIEVAGIKWAKSNLKIGSKEHFTFEEAQKFCPKGWRVPTNEEQRKLRAECSFHFDESTKEGVFTDKETGIELRLPAAGFCSYLTGSPCYDGACGYYWSSTQRDSTSLYDMHFDKGGVCSYDNSHNGYGFSVRCVRD